MKEILPVLIGVGGLCAVIVMMNKQTGFMMSSLAQSQQNMNSVIGSLSTGAQGNTSGLTGNQQLGLAAINGGFDLAGNILDFIGKKSK